MTDAMRIKKDRKRLADARAAMAMISARPRPGAAYPHPVMAGELGQLKVALDALARRLDEAEGKPGGTTT